jgi:hypothetical protein
MSKRIQGCAVIHCAKQHRMRLGDFSRILTRRNPMTTLINCAKSEERATKRFPVETFNFRSSSIFISLDCATKSHTSCDGEGSAGARGQLCCIQVSWSMIGGSKTGTTHLTTSSKMVCSPIWLSEEHSRYLCRTSALLRGYEFRVVYDGTNLTALMSFAR